MRGKSCHFLNLLTLSFNLSHLQLGNTKPINFRDIYWRFNLITKYFQFARLHHTFNFNNTWVLPYCQQSTPFPPDGIELWFQKQINSHFSSLIPFPEINKSPLYQITIYNKGRNPSNSHTSLFRDTPSIFSQIYGLTFPHIIFRYCLHSKISANLRVSCVSTFSIE